MRFYTILSVFLLSLALGGCLPGTTTDGGEDPMSASLNYYYGEFPEVAIPNEMKSEPKDMFVSYTAEGIKLGTQHFKGRVDSSSLINALQGYMHRDSWILRSAFRGGKSAILIFERQQRMCSMYVYEDVINTGLLVFVSPKLAEGALQYNAPAVPSTAPQGAFAPIPSAAPIPPAATGSNNGNVTVYPVK